MNLINLEWIDYSKVRPPINSKLLVKTCDGELKEYIYKGDEDKTSINISTWIFFPKDYSEAEPHNAILRLYSLKESDNGVLGSFYMDVMALRLTQKARLEKAVGSSYSLGGAYNGYVVVSSKHPLYGWDDSKELPDDFDEPHGGITFSEQNGWGLRFPALKEIFGNDYWVLGFDTNHCDDTLAGWYLDRFLDELALFDHNMRQI